MTAQRGFTLLELIVVIAIFGVFSAMAYGGLSSVLKTRRDLEIFAARTAAYQKAYQRLREDYLNASARGIRDGDGVAQPAFGYDGYYHRIEFTRGGWSNPVALPRATLERVSYFLDDSKADNKKLVRRSWRVLDRAPQTQPVELTLLEHVEELKWRFMDRSQEWHENWQPVGQSATADALAVLPPPLAVEMSLRTSDWGQLRFVFRFGPEGLACMTVLSSQAATADAVASLSAAAAAKLTQAEQTQSAAQQAVSCNTPGT